MLTRVFALAGLVLALGTLSAQVEFRLYASGAGRYKVVFPGAVKSESFKVKSGKGDLEVTVDSVELRAGTSFLVSYIDAPEEISKSPAAVRFDKVRDGNKGPGGKVLSDKDLTVGDEKYPARDVLVETTSGCIRNRIIIVGPRLYQVMVQGTKEVVTSPSADRFTESFEVTK
jgi:hypothetical protein